MMRSELHEDDPNISIVTWSDVATGEEKVEVKQPELDSWVQKTGESNVGFDFT